MIVRLLDDKLRYLPELQDVRGEMLAKAKVTIEAAIQGMLELRREVEWDPKDEELNWRTLAAAHQRLGDLALSQNQIKDAMSHFHELNAIADRLLAADPENLSAKLGSSAAGVSSATRSFITWATTARPGPTSARPRPFAVP